MPDLTLEVLKDIRSEMREMRSDVREIRGDLHELRGDVHELRTEMRSGLETLARAILTGFSETERRLDNLDHLHLSPPR